MTAPEQTAKEILVVEDDSTAREALALALKLEGYKVTTAATAREALHSLKEGYAPCMIVLDLILPGEDGWQFRYAQLHDPNLAAIPVIVVSGEADLQRSAHEQFQAAAYLQKPINLQELLAAVGRHLKQN